MRHSVYDDTYIRAPWQSCDWYASAYDGSCLIWFSIYDDQIPGMAGIIRFGEYDNFNCLKIEREFIWLQPIEALDFYNWFVYKAIQR